MKNKDCPYRYHCRSWAIDKCEECNENLIRTSINSMYGTGIYEKSNIDIPSAYPNEKPTTSNIDQFDSWSESIRCLISEPIKWNHKPGYTYPEIKNVKISGPCTIIFWEDGTKTVMKCSEQDKNHFDAEKAILLAFYRKVTGFSKTHSQKELDKLTNEAYDNIFIESVKE